jgi:hypothetical protein
MDLPNFLLHLDFTKGGTRWLCKTIALANFLHYFQKKYIVCHDILPPYLEQLTGKQLEALALDARKWLDV